MKTLPWYNFPTLDLPGFLKDHIARPHPFLFADEAAFASLRNRIDQDGFLQLYWKSILHEAKVQMAKPIPGHQLEGRRLLAVSRSVFHKITHLGMAWKLSGEERFARRATRVMLAVAEFPDWNPSHFLDTAELTLALAIGYDWLHPFLCAEQARIIRNAIINHGLKAGYSAESAHNWWQKSNHNWAQVCYAGMIAGSLAVHEEDSALLPHYLQLARENLHLCLQAYAPNGTYPEGPSYWDYGTGFSVLLIELLRSSLGTSFGLENFEGFSSTAGYVNQMIGPSGLFFNYGDNSVVVRPMPILFWFARECGNAALANPSRRHVQAFARSGRLFRERLWPLGLLWAGTEDSGGTDDREPWQPHWHGQGPNPVVVHRGNTDDPHCLWVAWKGGSPSVNHAHMDVGSFVLEWMGERWVIDPGRQMYHFLEQSGVNLWDRTQNGERWSIFRYGVSGHNIPMIGGQRQDVEGQANFVEPWQSGESWYSLLDLTSLYRQTAQKVWRGIRFLGGEGVLLVDEFTGVSPEMEIRWQILTMAKLQISGSTVRMEGRHSTIYLHYLGTGPAGWVVLPAHPPPQPFDEPNPHVRILAFRTTGSGPECRRLSFVFSRTPEIAPHWHGNPDLQKWL